jgi:hypothetical protein
MQALHKSVKTLPYELGVELSGGFGAQNLAEASTPYPQWHLGQDIHVQGLPEWIKCIMLKSRS